MRGIITWMTKAYVLVTAQLSIKDQTDRDERGLSQSTENAILLAGAVTVAGIVIAVITAYVQSHLPS